ncbi:MAG: hypothetical protein OXI77_11245 [Chloroflexota bacterium]|nr:hypothetical protein [Chloroflexota bacterium]
MGKAVASLHRRDAAQHDDHARLISFDRRQFRAGRVQDCAQALAALDIIQQ